MHLSHIPKCTIQNRNANIFVLIGVLSDLERCIVGFVEYVSYVFKHHPRLDPIIVTLKQADSHDYSVWPKNGVAIISPAATSVKV